MKEVDSHKPKSVISDSMTQFSRPLVATPSSRKLIFTFFFNLEDQFMRGTNLILKTFTLNFQLRGIC